MKPFLLFACLVLLFAVMGMPATASPTISSISPATAPNDGDVTVRIAGSGFDDNTTVWIETPYIVQEPLYCTIIQRTPSAITCRFSLRNKAVTRYNLWVNTPFTDPFGNYHPQDVGDLPMGFTVSQGTPSAVTSTSTPVPSNGSISVSSVPAGAGIFIDNEYKGLTPINMRNIGNGNHAVLIRLAGYQDWRRDVVVLGDSQSLFATLVQIPAPTSAATTAQTIPATSPIPVSSVPKTSSPIGIEAGILAILGAALFVIKRE